MPLEALFNAPKALAPFRGWIGPEPETGYLWFDSPIIIGGVVEAGLILRGGCYAHLRDQHVTFELVATKPGIKRRIPLERIEWRSIRGGHRNRRRKGVPTSGKKVSETHLHSFDLNWLPGHRRMRGTNLPQACEIETELQSFETLREYVGNRFRINNIGLVSVPPWEYSLFDHGQ